ncbi:MAG TPA: XrtA/PEP-CTERM system TPR-repeat protein PrsT, partial [Woeseiaceae bacterium]|nr:XrtA/PEP-CTERM system TPR-repeat protein PrsT [Woeseiaceae bacterium]
MRVRNVLILCLLSMVGCGLATSNEERLDRAEAAFEEGAYRAAMIDARDVLRREPDNVRGRLLLGRVSLAVGDVAAAEKELRRAVDLGTPLEHVILDLGISVLRQGKYQDLLDEFPAEPAITAAEQVQWMLVRADALLGLGQIESARDVYSAAISSEPDNVLAKMGVVATYQAEQNLLQARITLDEVLAAHPEAPEPWLVSGEIDLRLQRYEEAATSFGRALELLDSAGSSATAARALAGLAAAQLSLQHTDAARETVSRLEALAPGSVSALQLSASLAYGDEDLDAAQQKLQLILQQAPDNTAAQMLLGVVHLESGNLAQAEMYLSSVVAGAPENIEARTLLAQTRLQLQRFDQARETLAPMLSEHNPDSRMLAVAALLDIETGNVDRGVEYLEQSVAASPNNAELKLQLAAAYVSAGRIAEAQALLDSVEPGAVDNDEYRRGLLQALVKFHEGAVDEAIASGQETAHRFPGRSEANIMIGYFHLSRREFEAARKYFELGASQTGGRAMAQRYLGAIDMAEGKLDTAEERYAAILKMQPHATWAMVAMAGIASEREDKVNTIRWLERARESDPADVASRALLARLYLGEQKFKEAETVSREAIAISPDNASLHNMLGVSLL